MTSGVTCQVRFARLRKPDSMLRKFDESKLKERLVQPFGGLPASKQVKPWVRLPTCEFVKRK